MNAACLTFPEEELPTRTYPSSSRSTPWNSKRSSFSVRVVATILNVERSTTEITSSDVALPTAQPLTRFNHSALPTQTAYEPSRVTNTVAFRFSKAFSPLFESALEKYPGRASFFTDGVSPSQLLARYNSQSPVPFATKERTSLVGVTAMSKSTLRSRFESKSKSFTLGTCASNAEAWTRSKMAEKPE